MILPMERSCAFYHAMARTPSTSDASSSGSSGILLVQCVAKTCAQGRSNWIQRLRGEFYETETPVIEHSHGEALPLVRRLLLKNGCVHIDATLMYAQAQ